LGKKQLTHKQVRKMRYELHLRVRYVGKHQLSLGKICQGDEQEDSKTIQNIK